MATARSARRSRQPIPRSSRASCLIDFDAGRCPVTMPIPRGGSFFPLRWQCFEAVGANHIEATVLIILRKTVVGVLCQVDAELLPGDGKPAVAVGVGRRELFLPRILPAPIANIGDFAGTQPLSFF